MANNKFNNKLILTGTNQFFSMAHALHYYQENIDSGYTVSDIRDKIKQKEIIIGEPKIKTNQEIYLNRSEGRYYIAE